MVETVDALRLERVLSKEEILEQYLNRAPYGAGTIGIEAASHRYFGKPSDHLSLAEAALLAGLPKSPNNLNPLSNLKGAQARQRKVLRRMVESEVITPEERQLAESEQLVFVANVPPPEAMHFTDWVMKSRRGGDVHTTLDRDLQGDVESHLTDHLRQVGSRGASHGAVVVLENSTCAVRAMVGSKDYWSTRGGAVNSALALRQPGSTLKPFTYALAFELGASPTTTVADIPTYYGGAQGTLYRPRNYEDRFVGPIQMGEALGRSLNVPAIRTAEWVGVPKLLRVLRRTGMSSLNRSVEHYGLGLTLGNGEVTLVELTQAYAMLARGGLSCRAHFGILDSQSSEQVFSPPVVELVTHILSDESLRMQAFGPGNALMTGQRVAIKTGTSSDWRDNWAIGFTDTYTIGVWIGDVEGRPMEGMPGVSGAGPLFRRVLESLPETPKLLLVESRSPRHIAQVPVCALSGKRPGPACHHVRYAPMRRSHIASHGTCEWHQHRRIDKRNGLLAGAKCPTRFVEDRVITSLPPKYAQWEAARLRTAPPSEFSPLCPREGFAKSKALVTFPRSGERFALDPGQSAQRQRIRLTAQVDAGVGQVTWMVDGERVGKARWPYTLSWSLKPGDHNVQVVAAGKRSPAVAFQVH
jgi:penicillin-binding protein 1C